MAQPKLPPYVAAVFSPTDPGSLSYVSPAQAQASAISFQEANYEASDADFFARHDGFLSGERQAEAEVLATIQGNLAPSVQSSLLTLGIASSMSDVPAGAPAGSIGSYAVARSLALNTQAYQAQARNELQMLNQMLPERTFGITGQNAIDLQLQSESTFNQTLASNNLQENNLARTNAIGQFDRNYAEYLREFARPKDLGIGGRTLDGLITGYQEGSVGGIWGGVFGALGGGIGWCN